MTRALTPAAQAAIDGCHDRGADAHESSVTEQSCPVSDGPEYKRLVDRLFNDPNRKLVNFHITPGERKCTAEELCAEINKALDQIERGECEEVDPSSVD